MSKRTRIFLGILLVYVLGATFLLYRITTDLDPRYRESTEESMVETAHVFASLVEQSARDGAIDVSALPELFRSVYARPVEAEIFGVRKSRVEIRLYVTDARGRVLFDSTGLHKGEDFSRWRDVKETLAGHYGARTTRDVPDDPATAVMYVSAPVRSANGIMGVVTVGKPVQSFGPYVEAARQKIIMVGAISMLAVFLLAVIASIWLVRPFGLMRDYAAYVREQRRLGQPLRAAGLLRKFRVDLKAAFHDMRDTLAGRSYVQEYVQTLTHELKSPLSAIRGAAELLQEPLPDDMRERFLGNITRESKRIQELVDRMLELAALERRRSLDNPQPVALHPLLEEVVAAVQPLAMARDIHVQLDVPAETTVNGDAFLLRRALTNLVDNAVDFSPQGGQVRISSEYVGRELRLLVRDQGAGLPAYAEERVFEKFFSLPRPHSARKGTGLGLSFVQEIAALHGGRAELVNHPEGGAQASLLLPR
ncbi:MAG: two-component system sensor histidine kinase CreC [Pedobacter sp.]|nr:two-component system sensor histidine kinase CreC [Pedobacter sp.]